MTELISTHIKMLVEIPNFGNAALVDSKIATGIEATRNIFMLNESNNILWQIEPATLSHGVTGYSAIYLGKDNELLAYSSNGFEYSIDSSSGKIIGKELIR